MLQICIRGLDNPYCIWHSLLLDPQFTHRHKTFTRKNEINTRKSNWGGIHLPGRKDIKYMYVENRAQPSCLIYLHPEISRSSAFAAWRLLLFDSFFSLHLTRVGSGPRTYKTQAKTATCEMTRGFINSPGDLTLFQVWEVCKPCSCAVWTPLHPRLLYIYYTVGQHSKDT